MNIHACGIHVQTGIADNGISIRTWTFQLTGWTDVDTPTALSANGRFHVEGCGDFSSETPILETDGFSIHLLSAHPDAETTHDTFLVAHLKPDLFDAEL